MKKAFTLAETLITLGIIGVVAALTLPTLIGSYEKNVVKTKLKKFYTIMNQAVKQSEVENGEAQDWLESDKVYSVQDAIDFYDKYLGNYINARYSQTITEADGTRAVVYTINDGSAFSLYQSPSIKGFIIVFYPFANKLGNRNLPKYRVRYSFAFTFLRSSHQKHSNYVEPYNYEYNEQNLYTHPRYGCGSGTLSTYCSLAIYLNGWEFPKDYPW